MATLTQASKISKKFFWLIVFFIASGIIALLILTVSEPLRKSLFKFEPVATVAFGKLPKLVIAGFGSAVNVSYSVETVSGELSELGPFAKVFVIGELRHSFGDVERIKGQAAKVGFTNPVQSISPDLVKFVDPKNDQRVLTVETVTGNLSLVSNWSSNQKIN